MMSLWLSLAVLLFISLIFIAWPLWRYRKTADTPVLDDDEINFRLAENVRIFREHLAELENNLASQAIDAPQFAQLKLELERNLLDDEASLRALHKNTSSASLRKLMGVKTIVVFCAIVLLGGIFFYQKHGSAPDVAIQVIQQEKMQQDYQDMLQNRAPNPALAQNLIAEYKERLKTKPKDLQYWFLLARAEMEVSNFASAAKAYQQVLEFDPQSPMIMAELAQAMFLRDGNKMSPPVSDLAKNALILDPKNTMALGLAGIDAFGKKNYRDAIRYWQKTIDLLGLDTEGSKALQGGIEHAKQQYVAEGGKLEDLTAKSAYAVTVSVSLGDKVKVSPDQIVFIYARAWKGSPMPFAITRIKASELPTQVTLDESMAMSPMASLAVATEIEVVARVSTDGTAKTKVGDWQAKQGPISMKAIPEKI
jgi:cytochrome c-type biogenesis protein CcmH